MRRLLARALLGMAAALEAMARASVHTGYRMVVTGRWLRRF